MAQQTRESHAGLSRQMTEDLRGQIAAAGNGSAQLAEHAAKRMQDFSVESCRTLQDTVEMNAQAMTRLIGCRTIGEIADVQRDYLKQAIDQAYAASRRLYGISAGMAEDIGSSVNATLHDMTGHSKPR